MLGLKFLLFLFIPVFSEIPLLTNPFASSPEDILCSAHKNDVLSHFRSGWISIGIFLWNSTVRLWNSASSVRKKNWSKWAHLIFPPALEHSNVSYLHYQKVPGPNSTKWNSIVAKEIRYLTEMKLSLKFGFPHRRNSRQYISTYRAFTAIKESSHTRSLVCQNVVIGGLG